MVETQQTPVQSPDYYEIDSNKTQGRKVGDFLIGFFGSYFGLSIFSTLISSFTGIFGLGFLNIGFSFGLMIYFALLVFFWVFAKIKGRRYISMGILVAVIIPLILLGACFGILFSIGI